MPIVILDFTSRAIVDKADAACIMSRVEDKDFVSLTPKLRVAAQEQKIDSKKASIKPTHVFDIYKMRRGQYKNVRIWSRINLGTGEREDLYMTRADNTPMGNNEIMTLFADSKEELYDWRVEYNG